MKDYLLRSILKLFYKRHAPLWLFSLLASIAAIVTVCAMLLLLVNVQPAKASDKVTVYSDSADAWGTTAQWYNNSVMGSGYISNPVKSWIPFKNITLSPGLTIVSVKIYFTADANRSSNSQWLMAFVDETNPPDPISFSAISAMSMTSAGQLDTGVLPAWSENTEYSFDVTTSFLELYTYGSWESGDGVGLLIFDNGSASIRSYYASHVENDSLKFERLEIEYDNPTATPTQTATNTSTSTETPTPTETHTPTATNTVLTSTFTITHTPTFTHTASETFTLTHTQTPTETPTPTITNTATDTRTPTNTRTPIPAAVLTGTYEAAYAYYTGVAADNYPTVILLSILCGIVILSLITWGVITYMKRGK